MHDLRVKWRRQFRRASPDDAVLEASVRSIAPSVADEQAITPTPPVVAALVATGQLRPEAVPMWAARWLADGLDTPALRELAGLSGRDSDEARECLTVALEELDVTPPTDKVAATGLALDRTANLCLSGSANERWVVAKVWRIYLNSAYDKILAPFPLGQLLGFEDEWDGGWGRTIEELRREIRDACERLKR